MPTARYMVRRDLDQCVIHTQRIQNYLTRTGRLYEADHSDIYKLFCMIMALVDQTEQALRELRGHI